MRQNRRCQLDKRDREDIQMQATEKVRSVIDEANRADTEVALKRQLGALWNALPPEVKAQMAKNKPDVAAEMDKMYGKPTGKWGSPWNQKGR